MAGAVGRGDDGEMADAGTRDEGDGPLVLSPELQDSIGLESERVTVVDHDPRWATVFAEVEARLRTVIPEETAAVEHVGSTAVPGLAAKPIIDIAAGLRTEVAAVDLIAAIEGIGFEHRGDFGIFGGRLFVLASEPDVIGAHLHVVRHEDDQWERYVAFRDGLRADAELAAAYANLKRRLAFEHADDRGSYTEAKFEFVLQNAEQLAARRR